MSDFELVRAALVLDTTSPTMLRWRYTSKNKGHCQAVEGMPAGSMKSLYPSVMINKKRVLVHHAVWMLGNEQGVPEGLVIDHIDSNPQNPHPSNLQAITQAENVRKGLLCSNALGFSWYEPRKVWRVRLRVPGQRHQKDIGNFKSMLDARAAYLRAVREVYYS